MIKEVFLERKKMQDLYLVPRKRIQIISKLQYFLSNFGFKLHFNFPRRF